MSDSTVEDFLKSYNPEMRQLVLKTRAVVLAVIPDAIEQVDSPSKIIAYGFGLKYADLICAIAPYKSYVNLIFSQAAQLPDPRGLLTGTGKRARHVKIKTATDIESPGVRSLLEAAVASMTH